MTFLRGTLLASLAFVASVCTAHAQETTIRIGLVKSISNAANLWAVEKGYFREVGIKLVVEDLDTSANVLALLAQNQLQIIEGGISAGYFNGLEKNLPITIVMDRVSSPLGHNLMLRPDLKGQITDLAQLKGKTIASNGMGSVSTYEVGKMLETAGLTINDVDVKVLPFPQMPVAFRNKAIDAGIVIPPFVSTFLENNVAVGFKEPDDLVKPHPLTIAVSMINTDFAKSNEQAIRNYYRAYLRGVRDYCNAYHGGKDRAAMVDLIIKTGTENRPELLHKYPWPARDPDGRINTASMLDMQDWYVKAKMSTTRLPAERLVNTSYIREAVEKAGPFELENKESKLPGVPVRAREYATMIGLSRCAAGVILVAASLLRPDTAHAQEQTVRVGQVRSLASLATMVAVEKGYFREAGIKVVIDDLDTSTDSVAVVAQNRVQIVEGGLSAAYFNAIEKNFPVTIVVDRASSPLGHKLLVRADLKDKIKDVADLKGRALASNSRGSITNYEIGKILGQAGLGFRDVDLKFIPFPQVAIAFANRAVDAAFLIPPYSSQIAEKSLGFVFADPDDFVTPHPMTIAVNFINTDWSARNQELVHRYYLAYMRGVREYCQAYHGGPNRAELIDIAVRTGTEKRSEMLHQYPWPVRNVDGRINVASMLDIQDFFVKEGLSLTKFPAERLVTSVYVDSANQKLGPFALANQASKLAGCR